MRSSPAARWASRSHRRTRSTRSARSGGHDRPRCPAVSAVRTGGSRVAVAVRVSCSRAVASVSQVDLRRALQISRPPMIRATNTISAIQPTGPIPLDAAGAAAPEADAAEVWVGGAAVVGGGVTGAWVGGAAVVGGGVTGAWVGGAAVVGGGVIGGCVGTAVAVGTCGGGGRARP